MRLGHTGGASVAHRQHTAQQCRGRVVLNGMSVLYLSASLTGNDGVVRAPLASDAIGAALRGVFGETVRLPQDMVRLLARLDGATR